MKEKAYEELRKEFTPNSLVDKTLSRLKTIVGGLESDGTRNFDHFRRELSLEEQLLIKVELVSYKIGESIWNLSPLILSEDFDTVSVETGIFSPTQKGIELYNKITGGKTFKNQINIG